MHDRDTLTKAALRAALDLTKHHAQRREVRERYADVFAVLVTISGHGGHVHVSQVVGEESRTIDGEAYPFALPELDR